MTTRAASRKKSREAGPAGPQERVCDEPACERAGCYRAPKSRAALQDYHWFCLEHVREYNKRWNYYAGYSESEIEAEIRRDAVWRRPSWPFSGGPARAGAERAHAHAQADDPFGFFDDAAADRHTAYRQWRQAGQHFDAGHDGGEAQGGADEAAIAALRELELDTAASFAQIRQSYRRLVKRHHPDTNGGCKAAEQRLKRINRAYATLKARYKAQSPA